MSRRRSLANRQLTGLAGLGILLLVPLFCCGALSSLFRSGNDPDRQPVRPVARKAVNTPDQAERQELPALVPLPLVGGQAAGRIDDEPLSERPAVEPAAVELTTEPLPTVYTPREWKDSTSKFTRLATFVSLVDGTVTLDKAEGGQAVLPLDKLSEADQQYAIVATKPRADPTAAVIVGKVVGVTDGDTLTVLDGKSPVKIRLEGIDSPEDGQDFSTQSKKALSAAAFSKTVRVEWKSKDKYDRTLGHIYASGLHVNLDLVEQGFAWHYKEYNRDPAFAAAELRARAARRGVWSIANPIAPWDYRHGQRNAPEIAGVVPNRLKGSPPAEPTQDTVIVYVTRTGEKYHRDGCRHLSRSKIQISLDEARRSYGPCRNCDPPL